MTENKLCKGCKYNNYPTCKGFIMYSREEMNIENLRLGFSCGQKDMDEITDFSIKKKSELELKIEDLQNQINSLKVLEK